MKNINLDYGEFNLVLTYSPADIVWFDELAYIATGFVLGELPDDSDLWEIYTR